MFPKPTSATSVAKPLIQPRNDRAPSFHTNPARHFVTQEVRQLLMNSSMYRVLARLYNFQRSGACVQNAEDMHSAYIKSLAEEGNVRPVPDRPGTSTSEAAQKGDSLVDSARQFMRKLQLPFRPEPGSEDWREFQLNYSEKLDPTVEDIVKHVAESGAVVYNAADILPEIETVDKDGAVSYSSHHQVLVTRTFEYKGSVYGICSDGNDLQKNPVMPYFIRYAEQHKIPLDELTNEDHKEIQRIIDQENPAGDLHVDQVKLTIVNLTEAVERSDKKYRDDRVYRAGNTQGLTSPPPVVHYPNYIAWASNVQVVKEPIPSEVLDEIKKSIDKNPQYVVFHKFEEE